MMNKKQKCIIRWRGVLCIIKQAELNRPAESPSINPARALRAMNCAIFTEDNERYTQGLHIPPLVAQGFRFKDSSRALSVILTINKTFIKDKATKKRICLGLVLLDLHLWAIYL